MIKHTPGEWEQSGCSVYSKGTAKPICLMSGPAEQEEREANARLIAAAPDLLEACKQILAYHERGVAKNQPVLSNHFLKIIEQAIAKAE